MNFAQSLIHSIETHPSIQSFGSWIDQIPTVIDNEKRFYLTGPQRAADSLLWLPVLSAVWIVGLLQQANLKKPKVLPYKRNWFDYLLGLNLIVCEIASTFYKYDREPMDVVQMLAPCHITTLFFIITILSANRERAAWAFNIGLYYSFFTLLALAVPDISMLTQPYSVFFFYLHHWSLVFVPIYYMLIDRFPLYMHKTYAFYFEAAGIMGAGCCFGIQQIISIYSGINVNYMLHPPPGQPVVGRYYLHGMATTKVIVGYIFGQLFPIYFHKYLVFNKKYHYDESFENNKKKSQ